VWLPELDLKKKLYSTLLLPEKQRTQLCNVFLFNRKTEESYSLQAQTCNG